MRTSLPRSAAAICLAVTALLAIGACGRKAGDGPAPGPSGTVAGEAVAASPEVSPSTAGKDPAHLTAYLPQVPEPWTLVQEADFSDGSMNLTYTRPGGPDLKFRGEVTDGSGEPDAHGGQKPVAQVTLGSHQGYIYPVFGTSLAVSWRAGDISYRMVGVPAEGGSLTVAEFKQVIGQLRWP